MIAIPTGWNRRLPLAAAAFLFAAGNLAFFLVFRASTHERRAALEGRRDELSRSVAARESEADRLAGQRERLTDVSAAVEEFYGRRIGTQEETLAAVVEDLHAALKDSGIEASQISYSTTADAKLPLTRLKIVFPVRSDYARFKKLLRSFETGRRWLAVESVAIRRDGEQPGAVSVQLELATYFTDRRPESPGGSTGSGSNAPRTEPEAPPSPARRGVAAARSRS